MTKLSLCVIKHNTMKTYGGAGVGFRTILTVALDECGRSPHYVCFTPGECASGIH
jgi:hypothetical protein